MYTLFTYLISNLDALVAYFHKRREPLVTAMLETVRNQVRELYQKLYNEKDTLEKELNELKAKQGFNWEESSKILRAQLDELHARIQARSPEMWPDEVEAIKTDNIIPAIKLYRQRTGLGLKDSKDAIESYGKKHKLGRWAEEQKPKFSQGDQVVCDRGDLRGGLYEDLIYTVAKVTSEFIYLEGVTGGWNHDRFRPTKTKYPFKFVKDNRVKCIDNSATFTLELNREYTVRGNHVNGDIVLEGVTETWCPSRFELVTKPQESEHPISLEYTLKPEV